MPGEVVVQIVGLVNGGPSTLDGLWLVEYDPRRPGVDPGGAPMSAHIACTPDRDEARRFNSVIEAHNVWRTPSGRPHPEDRPLTAFSISIERV